MIKKNEIVLSQQYIYTLYPTNVFQKQEINNISEYHDYNRCTLNGYFNKHENSIVLLLIYDITK